MASRFVRFGDFEIDREAYQLRRKDSTSPVRIEGLPLRLLMLMVAHRGEVVSRGDIQKELWGSDVFVDIEQGINTAIRKIRQALRDHPEKPRYLQTVVGRGYRFLAPDAVESEISHGSPSVAGTPMVTLEELGQAILAAAGLQRVPQEPSHDDPPEASN